MDGEARHEEFKVTGFFCCGVVTIISCTFRRYSPFSACGRLNQVLRIVVTKIEGKVVVAGGWFLQDF